MPESITITPTWAGILPALLAIITNAETVEARKVAEAELLRMARLADLYVASVKSGEVENYIGTGAAK
jgi:hypothetical protein